jgi:FKBP-type peptidyl-prolyl cis-trans isomerase
MKMNKNTWIAVVIAIFVVGFFLFGGTIVNLFTNPNGIQTNTTNSNPQTNNMTTNSNPSTPAGGLVIQDQVLGTGAEAIPGSLITVNYVGTLENGKKFDSSIDRGQPFKFVLGSGQVIQGWEQGFAGMKVGGSRKLIIPPSLGYGANQVGPIPPNSTLIFEVQLLGVDKAPTVAPAQ